MLQSMMIHKETVQPVKQLSQMPRHHCPNKFLNHNGDSEQDVSDNFPRGKEVPFPVFFPSLYLTS
eukprot:c24339_g4_i1 orf=255-449(-)